MLFLPAGVQLATHPAGARLVGALDLDLAGRAHGTHSRLPGLIIVDLSALQAPSCDADASAELPGQLGSAAFGVQVCGHGAGVAAQVGPVASITCTPRAHCHQLGAANSTCTSGCSSSTACKVGME